MRCTGVAPPTPWSAGVAHTALRTALVLLGCVTPAAEGREGNVLIPYAALNLTIDNNLFRLPADVDARLVAGRGERGDVIETAQAGLRADRLIGRQRLSFDISANRTRYNTYGYLNADLVNASGTWTWQLGHDLGGEVGSDRLQSLTGFSDIRSAARNVTTSRVDRATAHYDLDPSWRVIGGAYQTTVQNSSPERIGGNFKAEAVEGGASYLPASGNRITVRGRSTRASYPNRQFLFGVSVSNDYTQDDVEVEAYQQVSGHSVLSALLARTRRHYPDLQQRDFNGYTGRANWDWQASGKTLLTLGWKREIGAYQDTTNNYIVTDAVSLTSVYQAGFKTRLQGRLESKERRYLGDPGFVLSSAPRRDDRINSIALTLSHDLTRAAQVTGTVQRELRVSNTNGFNYADTTGTLSLQLTW